MLLRALALPCWFAAATFACAQDLQLTPPSVMPPSIQAIRQEQARVARAADVELLIIDEAERSLTSMRHVPPEISRLVITSERQLIAAIETLYPYFGFTGSESLVFEKSMNQGTHYVFRQYMDGVKTPATFNVWVDTASLRAYLVGGSLYLDRGYDPVPVLSQIDAMAAVEAHAKQGLDESLASGLKLDGRDRFTAEVVYLRWGGGALHAGWEIGVPLKEPTTAQFDHMVFLVTPDGTVIHYGGTDAQAE